MKITMNIECDNASEAAEILQRIGRGNEAKQVLNVPVVLHEERRNVSPGTSSITKIGATTKTAILAGVGMGAYAPNYKGKHLEHLKLLWSRREIGFDGSEFYKFGAHNV
jgi:hypothetical protein